MEKYVLKIRGGAYDNYFEDNIPLETDDIEKFKDKFLNPIDKEGGYVGWYKYTITFNKEFHSFDEYEIIPLNEWFEQRKIVSND